MLPFLGIAETPVRLAKYSELPDLTDYALKSELPNLNNYVTKEELEEIKMFGKVTWTTSGGVPFPINATIPENVEYDFIVLVFSSSDIPTTYLPVPKDYNCTVAIIGYNFTVLATDTNIKVTQAPGGGTLNTKINIIFMKY